ncbi:ladderlectin-like [Colossoma macropomum]|uniref:ladderlectin-like n=1 Tax=Colossoma macropomum TaxID=42526 RepID=UPI00186470B4|nr:ladderlectin-like [Colossoma macropomum]
MLKVVPSSLHLLIFKLSQCVVVAGSAGDNQPVVGASGWSSFGSRQFKFFTIQNTWEQAESTCKQFDAHLASVHNKNENNFIMSLIHTQADGVWLGGHTDGDSGIWFWTDFSDFDHTNWSPGEPNGSGKCLKIYNNGLWDDFHCDRQLNFVCAR